MIKEVRLENWKSFPKATLYLDPLTVLIGTNASGKSNVLDALEFLSQIAQGKEIPSILQSDPKAPMFRGGAEWAALKPEKSFTVSALIEGEAHKLDFLYSITIQTLPKPKLMAESLLRLKYRPRSKSPPSTLKLFWTEPCGEDDPAFPEPGSVTRERIHPYVIRTEKRQAIDLDGNPLFKPRITKLVGVRWEGHQDQKQLYDAVTEYVREGYDQAMIQQQRCSMAQGKEEISRRRLPR